MGRMPRRKSLAVSVDRMERGQGERPALREIREEFGLKTTAIVTLLDILAYLESGRGERFLSVDPGLLERMKSYYKTYGAT
jgi:orotate phosphoribosyltransferase